MRELQEGAELALLGLEAADLRDGIIRRADDDRAILDALHHWIHAAVEVRVDRADVLEVVGPLLVAVPDVIDRLLLRLGDMHGSDEAQLLRIHRPPVFRSDVVRDLPVDAERVIAAGLRRRHAQHAEAMAPCELAARGRHAGRHADFRMRPGIGLQLARSIREVEPLRLLRNPLAIEELQDDLEALDHAIALRVRIDAELERIRRQQARPHAEHHAPACLVIELDHAVRDGQRVVIRQRDHARSQTDAFRALGSCRNEHLGRRDDFIARGMMFTDPRFIVTETVQMLDQFKVAVDAKGRVLIQRMERGKKNAVAELDGHEFRS